MANQSQKNRRPMKRGKNGPNRGRSNSRPSEERSDQYRDDAREQRNVRGRDKSEYNNNKRYADNDISWYSKYPELLTAAAAIPYPYRPGMNPPLTRIDPAYTFTSPVIPGVMALEFVPSIGNSVQNTDPASIAVKEIYAKVRSAYSGSLDADPPDFLIYLVALDSVFSYIAWLKRVFRVVNAYTPMNYQLPDTVLTAMGFSTNEIQSLREDRVLLWQNINLLIHMTKKFTCPSVMDYFNRHYWMNDNLYTDENSLNAQFYMFNQVAWYQVSQQNEVNNPDVQVAGLALVAPRDELTTPLTITRLFGFGQQLISALASWDDGYTIAGYLARAYDGVPSFSVDLIDIDAVLEPVYSEEVLLQIENSTTLDRGLDAFKRSSFTITQDVKNNVAYWMSRLQLATAASADAWKTQYIFGCQNPYVSARSDAPTVADTVIATRLKIASYPDTASTTNDNIYVEVGTEIPLRWRVFSQSSDLGLWGSKWFTGTTSATVSGSSLTCDAVVEQFDWHPFRTMFINTGTDKYRVVLMGDVHNLTTMSIGQLAEIHRVCIYSELNAFNQ